MSINLPDFSALLNSEIQQQTQELAHAFTATAVQRDRDGGSPLAQRQLIRDSGLLALSIPKNLGGLDGNWFDVMNSVRILAQVDNSLAHVFGFHHLLLATVRLFARAEQWQNWFQQTAAQQLFWGNTLNPLDKRTVVHQQDGIYLFSGQKSFCSGAIDSDMLVASGIDQGTGKLLIAAIPTAREGIELHHDWDNIGQRQTDSGSATFRHVRVEQHELLLEPGPLSTPFACLRPLIAQLTFVNMFLGVAEGAFAEAKHYTQGQSRAWFLSGVERADQDPYILRHYGEFWLELESVRALNQQAILQLQQAWQIGAALSTEQRGKVAIAVATAKVAASRVSLDISNRMFEVTGARATQAALRLDRFWRNVRTQTLHDPVDYKIKELGEWALNAQFPEPSFYS